MARLIKVSTHDIIWNASKIIVLFTVGSFIYFKFRDNEHLAMVTWYKFRSVFQKHYLILIMVMALMLINWGLEAIKWQILVRSVILIKFGQALKGILLGLGLSFITPHGIGDYVGRVLHTQADGKSRLIGAAMLGRICQMLPTLLFGLIGIQYILKGSRYFYIIISILILVLLLVLFVFLGKLVQQINKFDWIRPYINIISTYSPRTVLSILILSILRYVTFSLQFVIILYLFLPDLPFHLNIAGITWIFLAKSVLPTFNFLSDLGVREFSAIYFFEQYHADLIAVFSASLTLWFINILLPTILSSPLIVKLKLRSQ